MIVHGVNVHVDVDVDFEAGSLAFVGRTHALEGIEFLCIF